MLQQSDLVVRVANASDETELLRLCRAKHQEECLRRMDGEPFTFSEAKVQSTLHRAIRSPHGEPVLGDAWCGVVDGDGDIIVGSIYISVQSPYDSNDKYLCEHWNWIYPEHRKSAVGKHLSMFSQLLAVQMGLPLVGGHVFMGDESPKTRFFKRMGYQPLGSMYLFTAGAN